MEVSKNVYSYKGLLLILSLSFFSSTIWSQIGPAEINSKCDSFTAELILLVCSPDEGNANGNVAIQVSGGSTFVPPNDPYESSDGYYVGNGIYEDDGLAPGTYTYTFADSNGCKEEVTFTISGDPCCDFTAEVHKVVCSPQEGNENGNVAIQVTGGTPFSPPSDPYNTFDGNYVGNGVYEDDGLDPGTYTYVYYDKNDCKAEVTFTISGDPCCDFKAELYSLACSQTGNPNGNVAVKVTGGTPFSLPADPYDTVNGNYVGNGLYEEDGLDPGTYTYSYSDKNGCKADVTFTIFEGPDASLYSVNGCSQVGNSDGNVAIQVKGGVPFAAPSDPYETFDGNYVGNGIYEDEGLDPGNYTYTYWDSNGCSDEVTFTIPDPLTAEATSDWGCGKITVQVSGGTPPYTSNYNQENNNGVFEFSLPPDAYELVFTDANGCKVVVSLNKPELALCDDFTFLEHEPTEEFIEAFGSTWTSEDFVSGVHAKIAVVLTAYNVHDILRVEINGVEILNLEAGEEDCGTKNDCMGDTKSNCAEFFVNCCDVVTFHVDGATCPDWGTQWDLDVTCLQTWGECFDDPIDKSAQALQAISSMEEFVQSSLQSKDRDLLIPSERPKSALLSIFPNPTNGQFYIAKSQNEWHTVKIMDASGEVVQLVNILGIENPQVDSSTLPVGLYIVEIIDKKGNVFVEKLMKTK